jgi:hypothetical protein
MSAAAFYDAARALKRELTGNPTIGLTQEEVDAFKQVFAAWQQDQTGSGLKNETDFFNTLRNSFGPLTTGQVAGIQRLLGAMSTAEWPIAWAAYGVATPWWETNKRMQPVEEGYYLGTKAAAFQKTLRYYPWFGRGDVQLTWERNYRRADEECGLNGALIADPSLALRPDISAKVLVKGMEGGWFSGKKLADYLPDNGPADIHQFTNARHIINGQDKAVEIAQIALKFQSALGSGGWA